MKTFLNPKKLAIWRERFDGIPAECMHIVLDGERIDDAVFADAEQGIVGRQWQDGEATMTETLQGKVRIYQIGEPEAKDGEV